MAKKSAVDEAIDGLRDALHQFSGVLLTRIAEISVEATDVVGVGPKGKKEGKAVKSKKETKAAKGKEKSAKKKAGKRGKKKDDEDADPTRADVRKALKKVIDAYGADGAAEVLEDFDVEMVSELEDDQFAAVIKAAEAYLEGGDDDEEEDDDE